MNIEWNPHIIDKINDNKSSEKTTLFLEKYQRARDIISAFPKSPDPIPLAYRLSPQLSDITDFNQDVLGLPKFGGIPDMSWWFSFTVDFSVMYQGKQGKHKTQDLKETIKKSWPVCCCCHKPLRFLGQVEISEWARVIHSLTCTNYAEKEYQQNSSYKISGLGSGDKVGLNSGSDLWWYIFFCDCWENYDVESSSAAIILKNKYRPVRNSFLQEKLKNSDLSKEEKLECEALLDIVGPDKDKCLWPEEEYKAAVESFMEESNIHPETFKSDSGMGKIPLQFLEDFHLRFDIDYPNVIHDDIYDYLYYGSKMKEENIFGINGEYQFFGRPHSQQEEPRFMCSYGREFNGFNIHRQAPIICWDDSERDMTHQMYGCLRCSHSQTDTVWARMDHSCT